MKDPLRVRMARRFSPWMLLLALLTFLLPFVSVSCSAPTGYGSGGGGVTAAYSGIALAAGGEASNDRKTQAVDPASLPTENHADLQPLVAVGLLLVIVSLIASLALRRHPRALVVLVGSLLAAMSTLAGALLFKAQLTDAVTAKLARVHPDQLAKFQDALVTLGGGVATVCALLAVTAALNALALSRERDLPPADPPAVATSL